MKKKINNVEIDKHINSTFDTFLPELDNNEIWNNIEPKLKKKKDRKIIFWLLFGGLLTIGGIFYFSGDSASELIIENAIKQEPSIKLKKSDSVLDEKQTPVFNTAAEKESSERLLLKKNKNSGKVSTTPTELVSENLSSISNDQIPKVLENNDSQKRFNESVDNSTSLNLEVSKNPSSKRKLISSILVNQKVLDETNKREASVDVIEKELSAEKVSRVYVNNVFSLADSEINSRLNKQFLKAPSRNFTSPQFDSGFRTPRESRKRVKPSKKSQWQSQVQFSLSAIYGLENFSGQMESNISLLNYRNQFTTQKLSFGASFKYILEHKNGLMLIGGIDFMQLNEKIFQDVEESETATELIDVSVTENAQGEIINREQGFREVTYITMTRLLYHNQYRFFNIPIGLGYSSKFGKGRLKYIGGLDYNLTFRFNGHLFDNNLFITKVEASYSQKHQLYYKSNHGIGLWGGVEWHYPLNERCSFLVAPNFQYSLSNITAENNFVWYKQSHLKLKLDLGFNYILANYQKKRKRR